MHCVLSYPTSPDNANLAMIQHLALVYPDAVAGYSDHTVPDANMIILTTAYLIGAKVLEKHFTLDKTIMGNDHYHAFDEQDVKKFTNNIDIIHRTHGEKRKELCSAKKKLVCMPEEAL